MSNHRLSAEEVNLLMVDRISDAIRPVLIPWEEQDCAIQAENSVILAEIAAMVWAAYARMSRRGEDGMPVSIHGGAAVAGEGGMGGASGGYAIAIGGGSIAIGGRGGNR